MDPVVYSARPTLPNFIYVSELLRTWETAVLLFLRDSIGLTLFISPYLRESGPINFTSDRPGELKEQFKEFVRFIHFLRQLKKSNINGISELIPNEFSITLKHFGGAFVDDFIDGIEKPDGIELTLDDDGIVIKCTNVVEDTASFSDKPEMSHQMKIILDDISVDLGSSYVPYNESEHHELTFPPESNTRDNGDMNTPSTPSASIADFIVWYKNLNKKPHGEGIVYFVAHSGTMKKFVKQVEKLSQQPSQIFNTAYDEATKTNTWSLFFKIDDEGVFKGFRHAYSCDNRYMDKGFNPLTFHTNFMKERWQGGYYTNLGIWGIFSTLKFSSEKVETLVDDKSITSQTGLKICKGMKTEPRDYHGASFDNVNPLCGQQRDRVPIKTFSIDFGHCGTKEGEWGVTLDKNCIRIITEPKGPKVVLYLDKKKDKIEARFFISAETSTKYTTKIDLSIEAFDIGLSSIVYYFFGNSDKFQDSVDYLKSELIESIKNFIESKTEIDPKWKDLLTPLYQSYTDKKAEKAGVGVGVGVGADTTSMFDNLSNQQEEMVVTGGTNKRTRRHRKHKVMKKYTRKHKKYNPRRKSRRIQKRKQTHKRKLAKKSRKSWKSRK